MKTITTRVRQADGTFAAGELTVRAPSAADEQAARIARSKALKEALAGGAMGRLELEKYLRGMSLWDDQKQARFDALRAALVAGELALEHKRDGDGKPLSITAARELALRMGRDRDALASLLSERNALDGDTAEAMADGVYFEHLVARCTVYGQGPDQGRPYFTRDKVNPSVADFAERSRERAAQDAAAAMGEIKYGPEIELLAQLPEARFLRDYGFVDAQGRLTDRDGNLVDDRGRRVDAEGFLLDGDGRRVDDAGNLVTEDGSYVGDADAHFVDDEGNPVLPAAK